MRLRKILSWVMAVCVLSLGSTVAPLLAAEPAAHVSRNTLQAAAFKVADISVQSVDGHPALSVTFSQPVNVSENLEHWLDVTDYDGERIEGGWTAGGHNKVLYFNNVDAERDYRVVVKSGLPAANGDALTDDSVKELETPAMPSAVGFASRGSLLASKISKGLPVIASNVDEVNIDIYRVPPNKLNALMVNMDGKNTLQWDAKDFIEGLKLSWSGKFDLKLPHNTRATRYLPIGDIEALEQNGVYLAIIRKNKDYFNYHYPVTWFAISDLGVQVRIYDDQINVNVTSLKEAEAESDVQLQLVDSANHVIATKRSDGDGRATFQKALYEKKGARFLVAHKDGSTSVVKLFGPALDLSEFPVTGREYAAQDLFIYSPRDLYRPGETMTFSALLRSGEGKAVPGVTLTAELISPEGKVVKTQRVKPQALNYYELNLPLAADAATGNWRLKMYVPGHEFEYPVKVETFLPERMSLDMTAPEQLEVASDLDVMVDGQYLYGAPADGNRLQSQLIARPQLHPFPHFKDFTFGNPDSNEFTRRKDLEEIELDDSGKGQIHLDSYWKGLDTPLQLKVYARLLDEGGRPVTRATETLVMPNKAIPGLRPLFSDNQVDYNSDADFEVVLTDGEKRLAAKNLDVTLVNERRDYTWSYSESEGWDSSYTVHPFTVMQTSVSVKDNSVAHLTLPVDWGHYRVDIRDPETGIVTRYRFYAGWTDSDSQVMSGRPDRIGMALGKKHYQAGDKVEIKIKPAAAGHGFLVIEGKKPLYWREIDIPAEGKTVSFTLDKDWVQEGLYASVMLLQPGDDDDHTLPKRMLGIEPILIDHPEQSLNIAFPDLPPSVRPEQTVHIPVKVTNAQGSAPKEAFVTLSAVDVGILNITDFASPDPEAWYFGPRRYRTDMRDNYGDLITADDGELAQLRFGGDSDLMRGGDKAPTDVQIISLFSGAVKLDANGQAKIPVKLPAFNGKLRLMAVAFGKDQIGSHDQEVNVVSPVVAELNRPRFLTPGDTTTTTLSLRNMTDDTQTLDLSMKLEAGLHFADQSHEYSQQVTLKSHERKSIPLKMTAETVMSMVPIHFRVDGIEQYGATDSQSRDWAIRVRPGWPAITRKWQSELAPGETFNLADTHMNGLVSATATAQLSVSNMPSFNLAEQLRALRAYPYGCLEQTTSGVFASLYANDSVLDALSIGGERQTQAERDRAMSIAISRLFGMQKSNGSFGLWNSGSPEEPWLSVYVTDFLLRAQAQGYQVPEAGLERALLRLRHYVASPDVINGELMDAQRSRVSVRAYAAMILARSGHPDLASTRVLYDNIGKGQLQATPLAMVQTGLALQLGGDRRRGDAALSKGIDRLEQHHEGPEHRYWHHSDYGSTLRDRALAVFWILEQNPQSQQWQTLAREISNELNDGDYWYSTQERNALFLAGQQLLKTDTSPLNLKTSGAVTAHVTTPSLQQQLAFPALKKGLEVTNNGDRPAFLSLVMHGFTNEPPKAVSNGISVTRDYFTADGEPTDLKTLTTGDEVIVRLHINNRRKGYHGRHLLVVDLLPAGLELENQNLKHSLSLDELKINGEAVGKLKQQAYVDVVHEEYRDDRYVAAVKLPYWENGDLYYLARAVTPGEYHITPTAAEDMYRANVRHHGNEQGTLTVKAK